MKKTICFLLIIGFSACASTGKLSKDGQVEKAFVAEFVRLMIENKDSDYLRNYISPKFCQEKDIQLSDYSINTYLPDTFEMEHYDSQKGNVDVIIKGINSLWVHRLNFRVVKEAGKLYLRPSDTIIEDYIDPWYAVYRYLNKQSRD